MKRALRLRGTFTQILSTTSHVTCIAICNIFPETNTYFTQILTDLHTQFLHSTFKLNSHAFSNKNFMFRRTCRGTRLEQSTHWKFHFGKFLESSVNRNGTFWNCHSDSHGKGSPRFKRDVVYWYSNGTSTWISNAAFSQECTQIFIKPSLQPTTFRYRRKPSAICSVHHAAEYLSHARLPYHNKPHYNRTAENKEAIFINLIIIYLFILV